MKTAPIRLVTLNIAHARGLSLYQGFSSHGGIGRQLARIKKLLRRLQPDVVCLQEVDEQSHWNRHINLLEPLQDEVHLPYGFLGVHNRRGGSKALAYGNAVLSRYPLRHAEVVAFGNRTLGEKGFVYAEVELPYSGTDAAAASVLPLINLHLDFQSKQARCAQVDKVLAFLDHKDSAAGSSGGAEHDRPAPLICGDFNARRANTRDAVHYLWQALAQRHAYTLFPERSRTFPSVLPVRGLDFILLPAPFQFEEARVVRSYVSDHRPVFASFAATI